MKGAWVVVFLSLGFAFGWFARDLNYSEAPEKQISTDTKFSTQTSGRDKTYRDGLDADVSSFEDSYVDVYAGEGSSKYQEQKTNLDSAAQKKSEKVDVTESLVDLLNQRKYREVISLLRSAERQLSGKIIRLRNITKGHLKSLLAENRVSDFTDLSDLYLSLYYDDVDVLLLLAESNTYSDFYIDALSMYQLAFEYAYTFDLRKSVEQHFDKYIVDVHKHLAKQEDWYTLSQIYQQAEVLELLSTKHLLGKAEALFLNGDTYTAKSILNQLIANSEYSDEARQALAKIEGDGEVYSTPRTISGRNIKLTKSGNHFLVNLKLGPGSEPKLLIDTGASLTTLSEAAFAQYDGRFIYEDLGYRMFHTAGGLTKGRVIRVDSMELGGYPLKDVLIALLDFDTRDGVEGLLGMNVLGRFKFQIDQETNSINLSPR